MPYLCSNRPQRNWRERCASQVLATRPVPWGLQQNLDGMYLIQDQGVSQSFGTSLAPGLNSPPSILIRIHAAAHTPGMEGTSPPDFDQRIIYHR